jgi:hypothetical protein
METHQGRPGRLTAQRALEVYVAICTVLVLIVLYGAFARPDQGVVAGELYVRTGVSAGAGE